MGGSAWQYYVPFESDPGRALARLREEVFRSGQYYLPSGAPPAASIEQLLEMSGENGTHSVLDILDVANQPAPGVAAPLSSSEIIRTFGSDRPTRKDVERATAGLDAIRLQRGRWSGTYLVVYDHDAPAELLFFGYSGD